MADVEVLGDGRTAGAAAPDDEADRPVQHSSCRNCGAELHGDYCHSCGQKAHVHRTFGAFWHDVAHSVLHFEGKIWRTLPMLAWRPGELTRRYSEGERARFVSPMGMFLFSAFLMFAVFNAVGAYAYRDQSGSGTSAVPVDGQASRPDSIADLERQHAAERSENLREIDALDLARRKVVQAGGPTAMLDADIAAIRREMELDQALFRHQTALQRSEEARTERHRHPIGGIAIHPKSGVSLGWLDEAYGRAKQNPKLLVYKLQSNAYKFSWALIPISVPLVWLLFRGRRYRRFTVYDHTVFVTYSITFMSLFAIAYTLLKVAGMIGPAALLPFLIPPIHIYRHVRGAYELPRISALWRTVALLAEAAVSLAVFGLLLLVLGVLG